VTEPERTPPSDRELLVVYADQATADAARDALRERGVPDHAIHVGEEPDVVAGLRAEMHEELSRAWVVPNAGVVYPEEAGRGLVLLSAVGAAVGLLAAFPLALIDLGSTYWVRWVVWAVVGVAFGLAVALVAGPATAAPRPGVPPAAARGVLLRVEDDTAELRHLLADLEAVRIDEVTHDGDPVGTILSDHDHRVTETAKDVAANASGDDHNPVR
jgi:hypothetical protein